MTEESLTEALSWICKGDVPSAMLLFSAENQIMVAVAVRAELVEWVFKNLISYSQVNAIEIFFPSRN